MLASGLIIYLPFAVLYGANVDIPQMPRELFGYDAFHAGLILSPSAVATMIMMPVVGLLLGRKIDARSIVPVGLLCVAGACYWQANLDLYASPTMFVMPRFVQMAGVGMLFVPLNQAAYLYLKGNQINNATGIFNMLRNEGGSLGTAIVTVMGVRRGQFHQQRLAKQVRPGVPAVSRWLDYYARNDTVREGVTTAVANQQSMGQLGGMVTRQARPMAYLDVFSIFFLMALAALPLVFPMKKAIAKPGPSSH